MAGALAEAAQLFVAGGLKVPVTRTFALAEAAQAQTASEAGHVVGKLIIHVP